MALAVPDLAGFGRSAKVIDGFGPDTHADLVAETMRDLGLAVEPAVVVAHSLGCLVAIRLARRHPDLVGAIVAFSPPLYEDEVSAKRHLSRPNFLIRLLVLSPGLTEKVCDWMCVHHEAASRLGRWVRPDLPSPLAEDRLKHTSRSYSETMTKVILAARAAATVGELDLPIHLVAGSADTIMDLELLADLADRYSHVTLSVWAGARHELALTHPIACLEEVRRMRRRVVSAE